MSPLETALRSKYKTPQEAMRALGLDEALLTAKDIDMPNTVLSRKAAVAKGALLVYLRPKLAQDAKIDLTPVLAKITKDNFKAQKPGIIAALIERTKGKLARDATLDDAGTLLDSLEALDIVEKDHIVNITEVIALSL